MLYLFDLDDTLVRTGDLESIRLAGVRVDTPAYKQELRASILSGRDRKIWTTADILRLVSLSPLSDGKPSSIGVFTRAPRSYATEVLSALYPDINWDTIVCYEDVAPYFKPHGQGIRLARERTGQEAVFVIGNDSSDLKAAYHAVCYTALDNSKSNYEAWSLLPDFTYKTPSELLKKLENAAWNMMPLEAPASILGSATPDFSNARSIVLYDLDGDRHMVTVLGRHFSRYGPIRAIRGAHELTSEIETSKNASSFPATWTAAILDACYHQLQFFGRRRPRGNVILTCVPPRPGRPHRLGNLIQQCAHSYRRRFGANQVTFDPYLFGFLPGVKSNSNDHLGRQERFENISSHLVLSGSGYTDQDTIVVLDDVVTTGSTLIGAKRLIMNLAGNVQLLAIAKNIGDIMPEQWKSEVLYEA